MIRRAAIGILLIVMVLGCGKEGDEKSTTDDDSNGSTGEVTGPGSNNGGGSTTKTVCSDALASFTDNVAPMIERCQECHTTGAQYDMYMNFGSDHNKNRLLLRDKKGSTASALYTFLSGHTGQTALEAGDEENLETWFTAEKTCPAGSDGLQ